MLLLLLLLLLLFPNHTHTIKDEFDASQLPPCDVDTMCIAVTGLVVVVVVLLLFSCCC